MYIEWKMFAHILDQETFSKNLLKIIYGNLVNIKSLT